MKKISKLLVVIIVILISNKLSAQIDTYNYIKEFETQKANYIGKPFSILMNNIVQVQPIKIWSFPDGQKKILSYNTKFYYIDAILVVEWQEPIPREQTKYYENKNQCKFTSDEKTFFGNKIIKDIVVYK